MNNLKEIKPYNEKGEPHGFWDISHGNYSRSKGIFINGVLIGYIERGSGIKQFYLK